jgi:hypothetical protein
MVGVVLVGDNVGPHVGAGAVQAVARLMVSETILIPDMAVDLGRRRVCTTRRTATFRGDPA